MFASAGFIQILRHSGSYDTAIPIGAHFEQSLKISQPALQVTVENGDLFLRRLAFPDFVSQLDGAPICYPADQSGER